MVGICWLGKGRMFGSGVLRLRLRLRLAGFFLELGVIGWFVISGLRGLINLKKGLFVFNLLI